jgi:hypothetical protein
MSTSANEDVVSFDWVLREKLESKFFNEAFACLFLKGTGCQNSIKNNGSHIFK